MLLGRGRGWRRRDGVGINPLIWGGEGRGGGSNGGGRRRLLNGGDALIVNRGRPLVRGRLPLAITRLILHA